MKLRYLVLAAIVAFALSGAMEGQTYNSLWKQVEKAKSKSLPKTVIRLTEQIFLKAEKEKNSPQMLKSYLVRMNENDRLTPDSFYVNVKNIEQLAGETDKLMDKAILYSILSMTYADYGRDNSWELRNARELTGENPANDIREWSKNLFVQQVIKYARASLDPKDLLLRTNTQTYIPFINQGKKSKVFRHDMYHMLGMRAIYALNNIYDFDEDAVGRQIRDIFESMQSAYRQSGSMDAYVRVRLDYLEWLNEHSANGQLLEDNHSYLKELEQLMLQSKGYDICAEIYLAEVEIYRREQQLPKSLQLCDEAIRYYPKSETVSALTNKRNEILKPYLDVSFPTQIYPQDTIDLKVIHCNIGGFTLEIYKDKALVIKQHYMLNRPKDYLQKDTVFQFSIPKAGGYTAQVVPDISYSRIEKKEFCVSRFKIISLSLSDVRQSEMLVLDSKTGYPVANAQLIFSGHDKEVLKKTMTDRNGRALVAFDNKYRYVKARKGDDAFMSEQSFYENRYSSYNDGNQSVKALALFTDRSIYRPGQTVYVKGIAYEQSSDTARVLKDQMNEVILKDANNQQLSSETVRTNDFGSFATSFKLPSSCLDGMYKLVVGKSTTSIRVEEYKRPTFDITFDKFTASYKLGDQVKIQGKVLTYSGVPMQDATVKYTVKRYKYYFWQSKDMTNLSSGQVKSDSAGTFSIPVFLQEDEVDHNNRWIYYRYEIEASVTNVAGETQSSTMTLAAGKHSLLLNVSGLEGKICADSVKSVIFKAENLNGEPVNIKVVYKLYFKSGDVADNGEPVQSGSSISNQPVNMDWKTYKSGAYLLVMKAKDHNGEEITSQHEFVLYAKNDVRPPVKSTLWYVEDNSHFDSKHPAVFYFGTSERNVYVLQDVFCGNKRLQSRTMILSDTICKFVYPYKESYGDGISVTFCFVRSGEMYQKIVTLVKRLPEHRLQLKWNVFRDKLLPGQKEEWQLTIRTPDNKPAAAEMLAVMYDAALDKIWKNRETSFDVSYRRRVATTDWNTPYLQSNDFNYWFPISYLKIPNSAYDSFFNGPSQLLNDNGYAVMIRGRGNKRMLISRASTKGILEKTATLATKDIETPLSAADEVGLRTNFAETAFFYPQLRANEKGEIALSFILPQSLTRWTFRGYAHTQDMMTGILRGETTAVKDFMLTSNMPRFVRVGDKASVAASVMNKTEKALSGAVTFTLFDPVTGDVVGTQKQSFTVAGGKSTGVDFQFTATDQYSVLACKMVANSENFSDGEQRLLPVLSSKINLTESLAMPLNGNEKRTFTLDSLFNHHSSTATNRRLTVEFTGNPAWYAVQALSVLNQPVNNSAISWATVLYTNSLAASIVNSQPKIKAVFDVWKTQGGKKDTFMSNLQKNQEVKNILLSESPWLVDAQNERQRQERIATLFDLNNITVNTQTAINKLKELQNSDGSWSWYKGMDGNRYITAYIVKLYARLTRFIGEPLSGSAGEMQQSAWTFLHQEALKSYRDIMRGENKGAKIEGLSMSDLEYLYLVAISNEQVPKEVKTAYTYFLSKVDKLLTSPSMLVKAYAAVILDQAGKKKEAGEFIASLKEHLTQTEETGMSFAFNEVPYSWYDLKIPTHVAVLEAMNDVAKDSVVVEKMKIWLLKQKQIQQWNSPVSTIDAVYALLKDKTDLLAHRGIAKITIANQKLRTDTSAATSGLNYIKQTYTDKEVVNAHQITIQKQDAGLAWGAVYAQYEEKIADVKQQGRELNVKKKLYVEKMAGNKAQLIPITAQTILNVGDKVVSRLIISIDREMDFIQLKDDRGACFEPIGNLSGYSRSNGIGYYVDVKDASTQFFFDYLKKGVYVFEYMYRVAHTGIYDGGLATVQCAYAPEYASHSNSMKVFVNK